MENIKIIQEEYNISGVLNSDDSNNVVVESDSGNISLSDILFGLDGECIEVTIKKRSEVKL